MAAELLKVVETMRDKDVLRQEMQDVMTLAQKMIRQKYTDKLWEVIEAHRDAAQENPSKEMELLRVFKQFAPQNEAAIDQMMQMVLMAQTAQSIRAELGSDEKGKQNACAQAASVQNLRAQDDSLHADGVYDVDQACLHLKGRPQKNAGSMLAMLLLIRFRTTA